MIRRVCLQHFCERKFLFDHLNKRAVTSVILSSMFEKRRDKKKSPRLQGFQRCLQQQKNSPAKETIIHDLN